MYKPRRQVRGEGVAQMSTLFYKGYLVKSVYEGGGGGQKCPKFCLRGLYTAPNPKKWSLENKQISVCYEGLS